MRFWLAVLVGLLPTTAGAQSTAYVVTKDGEEIGRETLTMRSGTERSADGASIEIESRYGSGGATLLQQRDANGRIVLFRLRTRGATPTTILAAQSGTRLAVRRESGGAESARELPAQAGLLLMDEQAWTLLQSVAESATPRGAALTLVFPRTDQTLRVTATRSGSTVALAGELTGSIQLDEAGRLIRVQLTSPNLQVVRQAD